MAPRRESDRPVGIGASTATVCPSASGHGDLFLDAGCVQRSRSSPSRAASALHLHQGHRAGLSHTSMRLNSRILHGPIIAECGWHRSMSQSGSSFHNVGTDRVGKLRSVGRSTAMRTVLSVTRSLDEFLVPRSALPPLSRASRRHLRPSGGTARTDRAAPIDLMAARNPSTANTEQCVLMGGNKRLEACARRYPWPRRASCPWPAR